MSRTVFACIICGHDIGSTSAPCWLAEYRAVYTSVDGTFISGVGEYEMDDTWIVPSDPNMRYDDPDLEMEDQIEISVMDADQEDTHAHVFHDACWGLLRVCIYPRSISPYRFYRICKSLPFPSVTNTVSWGHDYGGLHVMGLDDKLYYPWEDRLCRCDEKSEKFQNAEYDPFDISELTSRLTVPRNRRGQQKYLEWACTSSRNCFSVLPWEIREMIARYLPTKDVLSLVKSSKAFLPLLTSQTFWSSRFQPGGDCDFIFEASDLRGEAGVDWIAIYKKTVCARDLPGLENRKRIWSLVQGIHKLLQLCPPYPPYMNDEFEGHDYRLNEQLDHDVPSQSPEKYRWMVTAHINSHAVSNLNFNEGCRKLSEEIVIIRKDLVAIAFSFALDGNTEYLVGMRFIAKDDTGSAQLGYLNRDKELYYKVTAVKGFIIAMGSRGLHALRVVGVDGRVSEWFGSPKDSPVTERLGDFESLTTVEIGYDGYKIVYLELGDWQRPNTYKYQPAESKSCLRETALWYPAVPAPNLFLNETSFTGEHPLTTSYQPLCYIHFGGSDGELLRSLTEIRVFAITNISAIEFRYEANATQPIAAQRLGRNSPEAFTNFAQIFSIDGPGGETIQSVEVSIIRTERDDAYSFEKHGKLESLKFTTNRGRSVHFQSPIMLNEGTSNPLIPMAIEPGTTITGLYGSQKKSISGLISLGVISEVIH